jgi:hypothetical protein
MRALLALAISFAAFGQVIDRIAVVVGNTVITETEVDQEARLEAFLNGTPLKLDAGAKKTAADRLVDQQLIRNEMKIGAYPEPTAAEVDDMLKNLLQEKFGGAEGALRASLQKYGLTEEQLRQHLSWQLAAIRFTDLRFSPAIAGIPAATATAAPPTNGNSGPDKSTQRGLQRRPAPDEQADRSDAQVPAGNVDEQLDAWLKQTRAGTKIQFKQGAFQ